MSVCVDGCTESFKTTMFEMLKADYSDTFVAKNVDPLSLKKLQSLGLKSWFEPQRNGTH